MKKQNRCHLIFRTILFSLASTLIGTAFAGEPKVKKQDPAIAFWYHFRSAITNHSLPKLQELTLFPFETTNADGSVTKNPRGAFPALFRPILDAPGINGKSMEDFVAEKEDLTEDQRAALKEGEIQIGSYRFRMVKDKCFFVGVILQSPNAPRLAVPPDPKVNAPATLVEEPGPTESEPVNLAASPKKSPPVKTKMAAPTGGPAAPSPTAPSNHTVFRLFWAEFRGAAMDNDVDKIKSLTRFPFETKGPLEDDRTKKVIAKEFDLLWPRLLETDPHSWGPLRDSMKELISRREEPSVEEISTEPSGQVQVGIFIFRKIKTRWLFTRAILAE